MEITFETATMTVEDIRELLELRGWSQADLARRLQSTEAAVSRWLSEERNPRGPAIILMRQWLNEARRRAAHTA